MEPVFVQSVSPCGLVISPSTVSAALINTGFLFAIWLVIVPAIVALIPALRPSLDAIKNGTFCIFLFAWLGHMMQIFCDRH